MFKKNVFYIFPQTWSFYGKSGGNIFYKCLDSDQAFILGLLAVITNKNH